MSEQNDPDYEVAEKSKETESLMTTIRQIVAVQNMNGFGRLKDKILPWRTYVDWERYYEKLNHLWDNPDDFVENGIGLSGDSDKNDLLFKTAFLMGLEYERAYPTGKVEDWPISLEERNKQNPKKDESEFFVPDNLLERDTEIEILDDVQDDDIVEIEVDDEDISKMILPFYLAEEIQEDSDE